MTLKAKRRKTIRQPAVTLVARLKEPAKPIH